jgi:hypothetical protein
VTSTPAIEFREPAEIGKVFNPAWRVLLASRLGRRIGTKVLALEFTGRKTGKTFRFPVGHQLILGKTTVLTRSTWRLNFAGGADARLRMGGKWQPARGVLLEDLDATARGLVERIEQLGWDSWATKYTLGLIIHLGRTPTIAELKDLLDNSTFRIIQFDFAERAAIPTGGRG